MAQPPGDEWFLDDDRTSGDKRAARARLLGRRTPVPSSVVALLAMLLGVFFVALRAAVGVFGGDAGTGAVVVPVVFPAVRRGSATPVRDTRTVPAPLPPTTTLAPGDTGRQVRALQRELTALGYPVGAIDGAYGP